METETENKPLPISLCKTREHSDSDSLIREWLFRFGVEHKEDIAPRLPVWLEAFGGMDAGTLEILFQRAMRSCKFFPKVSEILEPMRTVKQSAMDDAGERAWQRVLEIRRVHWDPDIPGPFDRAVAGLSERVRQAARVAGVFREFTADEYERGALHTWAKKRFIESFHAWDELEQGKFLLPDGETKKLLIECAETKALPWTKPKEQPQLPAEERLRVADQLAAEARKVLGLRQPNAGPYLVQDTGARREELRRQAELIKARYPQSPESRP
jgi:hypothetical protein